MKKALIIESVLLLLVLVIVWVQRQHIKSIHENIKTVQSISCDTTWKRTLGYITNSSIRLDTVFLQKEEKKEDKAERKLMTDDDSTLSYVKVYKNEFKNDTVHITVHDTIRNNILTGSDIKYDFKYPEITNTVTNTVTKTVIQPERRKLLAGAGINFTNNTNLEVFDVNAKLYYQDKHSRLFDIEVGYPTISNPSHHLTYGIGVAIPLTK